MDKKAEKKIQEIKTENSLKEKEKESKIEESNYVKEPTPTTITMAWLQNEEVRYKPVKELKKVLSTNEIIKRLSGGDLTDGSCSSLAFAYIGNKNGLDVLDYRDGMSRKIFATRKNILEISKLKNVISWSEKNTNDFVAVNKLVLNMNLNKEYYLATGRHAAIIRKIINTQGKKEYQFLELQSADKERNKFHTLTVQQLKSRFGCQKSYSSKLLGKYEVNSILIEADSLKENKEFKELLGYINTSEDKQKKGDGGYEK